LPEQQELTRQGEYTAPKDVVERQLVAIWEKVLHTHPVGIRDNFFELGGHSLLVAKLLRRIEEGLGTNLSMADIFQAPTVEQQAAALRDGSHLRRSSAVVPIQPTGSRPPLF